jgi:hypothetical protein
MFADSVSFLLGGLAPPVLRASITEYGVPGTPREKLEVSRSFGEGLDSFGEDVCSDADRQEHRQREGPLK